MLLFIYSRSQLKYDLTLTAGTKFISACGFLPYQNSSVSPTRFVYIWSKRKCCNWNTDIIEHSIWLHLPGIKNPAILCSTDNFLDPNSFLTMMTSPQPNLGHWHMPDSVCVPCYKRKSFQCLQSNLSMHLPVFLLPASFAPVTDLCRFTVLPQIHQRSTVKMSKN